MSMKVSILADPPKTGRAKTLSRWLQWTFPTSSEVLFWTLIFLMLFGHLSQFLFRDGNPGWNIRTGQYIIKTLSIPHHDIFSFSMPHAWWVAYEWGTQVIFAALDQYLGFNGIALFVVFVLATTYTLLYKSLRSEGFSFCLSFPLLLFVILGSEFQWAARPFMLSYLFVTLFYSRLDRYMRATIPVKRLWALPLLMILWVNLHPGFLAGVLLILTFLVGNVLGLAFSLAEARSAINLRIRQIGGIAIATIAASLLNPYGYRLYVYLFEYSKTVHNIALSHNELSSPMFQIAVYQPFLAAVIALIFLLRYSRYQLRVDEGLTLVIWVALGLVSLRNIPVMLLVCAPLYARLIQGLKDPFTEWLSQLPKIRPTLHQLFHRLELVISMEQHFRRHLLSLGLAFMMLWVVAHQGYWGGKRVMDFHFLEEWGYPAAALQYLQAHPPSGNVFNEWTMGGYLIYNFYPNMKVFSDGRLDFYGEAFTRQYVKLINTPEGETAKDDWKEVFDRYQIQWVMIPPTFALRLALDADPAWERRFLDDHCVIFVRKKPEDMS